MIKVTKDMAAFLKMATNRTMTCFKLRYFKLDKNKMNFKMLFFFVVKYFFYFVLKSIQHKLNFPSLDMVI